MSVVIETTLGDITVDLHLEARPRTCLNFLKLCKIKYYNLSVFHKVERNFIAQTGDPTATGRGGESVFSRLYGDQAKYFDAELKPRIKHEKFGTLSMVNNGNNMNGSQFFLTLGENLTYLDEVHTVFGEVVEGIDVLLKINDAICDPNNRPYQDILITHTVVLHDPYDDPVDLDIPPSSPLPTKEQLESNYIRADEEIDDTKGKSIEEVEEKIKESEAKARATILEMVGDIPDVDVKPPENVLFVCKLNPVTTAEDLEIIFSRFGSILSCEVIKDRITGDSLQYAFIEFDKEEDCESAYFKMDNVLIDDRRIHVDFSQSVSKLKWDSYRDQRNAPNQRRQNVVLKNQPKSDGYELVFDSDENNAVSSKKKHKKNVEHKSRHVSSSDSDAKHNYNKNGKSKSHRYRTPSPHNRVHRRQETSYESRSTPRESSYGLKESKTKQRHTSYRSPSPSYRYSKRRNQALEHNDSSKIKEKFSHHKNSNEQTERKKYESEKSHSYSSKAKSVKEKSKAIKESSSSSSDSSSDSSSSESSSQDDGRKKYKSSYEHSKSSSKLQSSNRSYRQEMSYGDCEYNPRNKNESHSRSLKDNSSRKQAYKHVSSDSDSDNYHSKHKHSKQLYKKSHKHI